MRVLNFSVLFVLSEVAKAESNDEGQFPDSGVGPVVVGNWPVVGSWPVAGASSNVEKLLDSFEEQLEHKWVSEFVQAGYTWLEAKAVCDNKGMELPVPMNLDDLKLLAEHGLAVAKQNHAWFWVGLNRKEDGLLHDVYTDDIANAEFISGVDICVTTHSTRPSHLSSWYCDQTNGGWPHVICVPTHTDQGVSCMNAHWTYNEDTEKCEPDADLSTIECGSTDMTISIHKAFVYEEYDGDVPSTIKIGNKDCTTTWDADNMAVFKINFNDECGQDIYHQDGTISISIDFDRSSIKEVDDVRIFTSTEDNMIWTFTCSYDDVISTKDSLEVSVSALTGDTTLHTMFPADAFPMKLVNVDAPSDPIKAGDMTRLTMQIPEGFPKSLALHFMTCTATADDDESITINIVKDGCALDVLDSADASTSENAISFTYTAFAFTEFEALTIKCDAKICLNSEVRAECMEMEDTCAEGYTDIF